MWMPQRLPPDPHWQAAWLAQLTAFPHRLLINHGQWDGRLLQLTPDTAAAFLQPWLACSAVYVGSRHGQPLAPFCAFSQAPELSTARLAFWLDHAGTSAEPPTALTIGLAAMVWLLLRQHPDLQRVLLPESLLAQAVDGLVIRRDHGVSYAERC